MNAHIYPQNGEQPGYNLNGDKWIDWGFSKFTKYNLPMVMTEFGYNTLQQKGYNVIGVDEGTQAKGELNGLFDAVNFGIKKTYLYELMDEEPDLAKTNAEMHCGLFHNDHD